MLTINLEKRLVAKKSKSIFTDKEKLVLKEANALLEKNLSDNDMSLLNSMGLDHSISEKNKIERKNAATKGLDLSRVFSEKEIKNLCLDYQLRCLNVRRYKGSVDADLPQKLNEFKVMYESENGRKMDPSDFHIVAPKESFRLEKRPVDPLLFYPLGNGMFYLVHKWGNDISPLRWLKALKMRNYWSWYFMNTLQYWVTAAAIGLFLGMHAGFTVLFFIGSIINFLIARYFESSDHGWKSYLERVVSENVWESEYN